MSEKIDPDHGNQLVIGPPTYLTVFLCLVALTLIMTGLSFIDLGIFNIIITLAIACTEATLTVVFMMHIKYSSRLVKMTILVGIFAFSLLICLSMTDYISRAWGMW